MNRIDELREKCVIMCMGVRQFDERQFAELLIRDCIDAIERTPKHLAYTTHEYGIMEASFKAASDSVKRHFQMD